MVAIAFVVAIIEVLMVGGGNPVHTIKMIYKNTNLHNTSKQHNIISARPGSWSIIQEGTLLILWLPKLEKCTVTLSTRN